MSCNLIFSFSVSSENVNNILLKEQTKKSNIGLLIEMLLCEKVTGHYFLNYLEKENNAVGFCIHKKSCCYVLLLVFAVYMLLYILIVIHRVLLICRTKQCFKFILH